MSATRTASVTRKTKETSIALSIDLDGEWGGELPVELTVKHQALRLVVP